MSQVRDLGTRCYAVIAVALVLCTGCTTPADIAGQPLLAYNKHTSYRIDDVENGFRLTVVYSRYQFVPDSSVVANAGWTTMLTIARETATARGRELQPPGGARLRSAIDRNGLSGMTSWLATGEFEYRLKPQPETKPPPQVSTAGTGFFISPDGLVLTAHHVVEDAKSIEVVVPGGKRYTARVLLAQPGIDLAILETDHRGDVFLPIPAAMDSTLGEQVFTIGFPATDILGSEPKFSDGTLSSLSGLRGDASMLQVSVPIQPGNSGGPLVNHRGEAIGVVVSAAAAGAFLRATGALPQNVNFAVRSDLCRPLIANRSIPSLAPCLGRDAAIERATRATVQVVATPSRGTGLAP
jgi:S1-C subfamily serine protease